MPFKLKLKKTRQYKVVSKSLFVMSVELLDGVMVECTLGADSSGQDCLDNVCQRLVIDQPELFGLRYTNRAGQARWVQLDRPLKRQLDKHAASQQLYLRVMYYVVSGTGLITDEVTRYHYFLQLKNDLIEGRIACDLQQAVVLASYSRQAEYGNLDRERHTVEYLKNLLQFPKQMLDNGQLVDSGTLAETGRLEWLTAAVIQNHLALYNVSQAQAEEGYISACQLLSGYGQEMFVARDRMRDADVMLAVSLTGVVVAGDTERPRVYRWSDITNVINHKRTFSIECAAGAGVESASFALSTPEDGKYIWRMCVLQHTFYMKHQRALLQPRAPAVVAEHQPKFQDHGLSESRDELDTVPGAPGGPLGLVQRAHSTSCLEMGPEPPPPRPQSHLRALLPTYRAAPDYETAIQHKHRERAQVAQYGSHLAVPPKPLYGSHPDIHRPVHYPDVTRHTVTLNRPPLAHDEYCLRHCSRNVDNLRYVQVYKPPPYPSGIASNSTPDLASQALRPGGYADQVSGSSPDLVSRRQYLGHLHVHAHGTYSNLTSALAVPGPHVILDHRHASANNIQKVYDEAGNVVCSVATHPYGRHLVLPQHKMADAHEPIYENVPLSWQNEGTVRGRAQSLTNPEEYLKSSILGSHLSIAGVPNYRASEEINPKSLIQGSHPSIAVVPNYPAPQVLTVTVGAQCEADGVYVNARMKEGVRNSNVPKDVNGSIEDELTAAVERMVVANEANARTNGNDADETPYQSITAHKLSISSSNIVKKLQSEENVTSILVPGADVRGSHAGVWNPAFGADSRDSSTLDLETSASTNGSVGSKVKKRRRWGMFIGRTGKTDVKSATLGRDRKPPQPPGATKHRWSTGLPKQPLPPSVTKETLCQLLERRMSDAQLSFDFERIPKGRENNAEMTSALYPENGRYNGYSDRHLPYEDNRVRLNPTPANKHGYINASHITMTVGSSQRFYVIARAPNATRKALPPTVTAGTLTQEAECALWWECVWQVGARVALLVSGDVWPPYLPERGSTEHYGKFTVRTECRQTSDFGYTSRARVQCAGKLPRTVWHVHYTQWPDGLLVPAAPATFLSCLSEMDGLRSACASEPLPPHNGNAPVVMGCAEGAGRSGTALAADLLLHTLDHNQELDLPRTVGLLHQQRADTVQNVHQYKFLHSLLLHYLKQSRLI